MLTFTIAAFLTILFTLLVVGFLLGLWTMLSLK
jgi:hypothetical protein